MEIESSQARRKEHATSTKAYLIAVVSVMVGLGARLAGATSLGPNVPYITFFPAVLFAAWYGGFGPGILATVLSLAAALWFIIPAPLTAPSEALGALLFAGVSVFISVLNGSLRRSHAQAKKRLTELEEETALRKQAELAEARERTFSHHTLASIGDAVIATDAEGRVHFMNAVAERLTGWSLAESTGQPIEKVFHIVNETTGALVENPVRRVIRDRTPVGLANHTELVTRSGGRIPIDDSGAPILDMHQTLVGAVVVFRDITERRRIEQALQVSERSLRNTLESITDAFIALDAHWNFAYVNNEAARLLRRSKEELLGENYTKLSQGAETTMEREFRRAVAKQTAVHFEVFYDQLQIWLEADVYPAAGGGLSVYLRNITARKQEAERLARLKREAETARDLLHTTLSSIADAVIAADASGKVTFINGVAQQLTGWSEADAIGKALTEVFVVSGKTLLSNDGREIPIEENAAPIRNESQTAAGMVLVFRDVTERRNAHEALKRSEERLRLALDAGQIGVWDWDVQRNFIEWSERVHTIHGMEKDAPPSNVEDFAKLIHPEDRDRVGQAIMAALNDDVPYEVDLRVVRPDGSIRWVGTKGWVFRDGENKPVRMLGATTDITEQKISALRLESSEERFRAAFANAPIGMVLTNFKGKFIQANPAYCEIVGYTHDELGGITFLSLTYADDMEENARLFRELLQGKRSSYVLEKRITRKNGEVIWVRASATMLHSTEGTPSEVIGLLEDISARKQAEMDRDALVEALQRSNEDSGRFAHAASHDLRSPLRTVSSMTQLLARQYGDKFDDDGAELIKLIVSATQRMDNLISDLLDFSTANQGESRVEDVPLEICLKDALTNLREILVESGAVIEAGPLPAVAARRSPLVQVFQNLIGNAVKYRSARPAVISIAARRLAAEWIIDVKDNGIGFDPQYATEVFRAFKRLHGDAYPGNGIGLASCHRIVERFGGRIWADSKPGEGSTFSFSLPARPQD